MQKDLDLSYFLKSSMTKPLGVENNLSGLFSEEKQPF